MSSTNKRTDIDFVVMGNYVALEELEEKKDSNIIVPDKVKDKVGLVTYKVVSLGLLCEYPLEVGNLVSISKDVIHNMQGLVCIDSARDRSQDREYLVIPETDIIGIYKGKTADVLSARCGVKGMKTFDIVSALKGMSPDNKQKYREVMEEEYENMEDLESGKIS